MCTAADGKTADEVLPTQGVLSYIELNCTRKERNRLKIARKQRGSIERVKAIFEQTGDPAGQHMSVTNAIATCVSQLFPRAETCWRLMGVVGRSGRTPVAKQAARLKALILTCRRSH